MAGEQGMKYRDKSFSVAMGSGTEVELTPEEMAEREQLRAERDAEAERVRLATQKHLLERSAQKITRKLVPYGTRILVKRRKVEDRSSHIILPDEVKSFPTDIADVIEVPEQTFTDQRLIANAGNIITALTMKACEGDAGAVDALLKLREYLQVMTIKKGDVILMARYGGTDFLIQETNQMLCVAEASGIYALVVEKRVERTASDTGQVEPEVEPAHGAEKEG